MHNRRFELRPTSHSRFDVLLSTLQDGPAWETSSMKTFDSFMAALKRRPQYMKKRLGTKAVNAHEALEATGEALTEEQCTLFRALAARANYLALDRPDCAFACKELCREFSRPTTDNIKALKKLACYDYKFEDPQMEARSFVDTDFAGCARTRRSTSGGAIMWGSHCIKHWPSTQPTIALSSGENELTGIAKGASNSLGVQSLDADLGLHLSTNIFTDASAV